MDPTVVLYPKGHIAARARIVASQPIGGSWGVITDVTPFHPVDHAWPDQPADTGTLAGFAVRDCFTGAVSAAGELHVGAAIPVRRGDPDWTWVVVHAVEPAAGAALAAGEEVELVVDAEKRRALSIAHTACHLAALALNEATADLWRKDPPRRDSLGNPDLDALAVVRSRIDQGGSSDHYRLGKSLRKKGLDTEALVAALADLGPRATARLQDWIATGGPVTIETDGDNGLTALRNWTCRLPEGLAQYPCGGTHVASLTELPANTSVEYTATDEGFLARTTTG